MKTYKKMFIVALVILITVLMPKPIISQENPGDSILDGISWKVDGWELMPRGFTTLDTSQTGIKIVSSSGDDWALFVSIQGVSTALSPIISGLMAL